MADVTQWVISRSREYFNSDFYESKAAAIAAAPDALVLASGARFYVGQVAHLEAPVVDADDVAEILYEHCMDDAEAQVQGEVGSDAAEGYPRDDISAGVRADVLKRIAAILTETVPTPACYQVREVEETTVPNPEPCSFCAQGLPQVYLATGTGRPWHKTESGELHLCGKAEEL